MILTKKIDTILSEMIEEIIKQGYKPEQIIVTQEHYDELFESNTFYLEDKYVFEDNNIVYYPKNKQGDITEYMGYPLRIGSETRIRFIKAEEYCDNCMPTHPDTVIAVESDMKTCVKCGRDVTDRSE